MRILVVEDEQSMARVVRLALEQASFDVDVAADGVSGLRRALEESYALIVLDIMLPGKDGWRICSELRERRSRVPILMLTARGAVGDRVRGLETGADDYLTKPFDIAELVARVHALLRRDRVHRTPVIRVADLEIDTAQRRVTRGGTAIGLSRREYELLEALAGHEGQVLTREAIQERVWMGSEGYSNTVDVCIGVLRRKVDVGHSVPLIHTVRGVGYCLRRPDTEALS